jgi:hypothetical protein
MPLSSVHSSEHESSSVTPPTCCCNCDPCTFLVLVDNCNGVTDDNFNITLNGTSIGNVIETDTRCAPPYTCRGHVIADTSCAGKTWDIESGSGVLCSCFGSLLALVYQTANLNLTCEEAPILTFVMTSIGNNMCGDYGLFRVAGVCNCGMLTWIYSAEYSGGTQTFTMSNPCCAGFGMIIDGHGPMRSPLGDGPVTPSSMSSATNVVSAKRKAVVKNKREALLKALESGDKVAAKQVISNLRAGVKKKCCQG